MNKGKLTGILLLVIISLILFTLLAYQVTQNPSPNDLDLLAWEWVQSISNEFLTGIFLIITYLGESWLVASLLILSLIIFLAVRKEKWPAFVLALSVLGGLGLNTALKAYFERARPAWKLIEADGYSFPSGHAMVAWYFYGFLAYLWWDTLRREGKNAWWIPVVALIIIILMGFSRVYLGVHYFTDILGGFLAGLAWFLICTLIYRQKSVN
ncbi:MAG: phosphatase PAP2 family protein [Bacillaceae bacterium]|nr:phosphatase PAP2 family protein [Bacillaceae bacterium]